jgi:signal transduction histidine kinase
MLGGRIDLVSELGRGTTVTVWLRDVPQREPA